MKMLLHGMLALILALSLASHSAAAEKIIDGKTYLRAHMGWRTPVKIKADGSVVPVQHKVGRDKYAPKPLVFSSPPPDNWPSAEFDDHFWARTRGAVGVTRYLRGGTDPAQWNQICVRARFNVPDPASAKGLQATVRYIGGAVVYINGKELGRKNLPSGDLAPDALAEAYPKEVYVRPDGNELDPKKDAELVAKRFRAIELEVPSSLLRKGVNTIAVNIRRAPIHEAYFSARKAKAGYRGYWGVWAHARMLGLSMSADSGVEPNIERPAGMQVWTPHPLDTVIVWHWDDPLKKPAIRLIGARNGAFSGRIVISSTEKLAGLKVTVDDLHGDGGTIPASSIMVRQALPYHQLHSWVRDTRRFDILDPALPTELAPKPVPKPRKKGTPPSTVPVGMLPVWVTVNVPTSAQAGEYRGNVTVSADGKTDVKVPLSVKVADWTIPDPKDWLSHNNLYHSPDTTAKLYDVELWSDAHFDLMRRSLEMGHQLGNKLCITPLIVQNYCIGNTESMVRWIDKGNGSYDYDFSVFDKYLDLYESVGGKPGVLLLDMWGRHSDKDGFKVTVVDAKTLKPTGVIEKKPQVDDKGKPVSYVYADNVDFWKPMFEQLLSRIEKRGWMDVAHVGTGSDTKPLPETVDAIRELWPDCRWLAATHMNQRSLKGTSGSVPIHCLEHVWSAGNLYHPGSEKKYPTCRPGRMIELAFPRTGQGFIRSLRDYSSLNKFHLAPEGSLQGGVKGIGRCGIDYLPIPGRNIESGRQRLSNAALCGGIHLGPNAATMAFVSAGKDGPMANERFEVFRQGTQIREAIIFVSNNAGKVGGKLAERIYDHLDRRARHYGRTKINWKGQEALWTAFAGSGLQNRNIELFDLCAKTAAALKEKP